METTIKEAGLRTPDPERSLRNLERLRETSPSLNELPVDDLKKIALLFSYSQFLADYCITSPDILYGELKNITRPLNKEEILSHVAETSVQKNEIMKFLRNLRKRFYLRLTLRYITGITDIRVSMQELSTLAEVIIQIALNYSVLLIRERFGDIDNSGISFIALGKLGADELNYSSDVDLLSIYRSGDSYSSGILLPSGVRVNRIHSHEYFCKLTETLVSLLSTRTEDGIAYRVDLRLRPNGQKGDISLPIESYLSYYEAWGKTWERLALIRARPVAGDIAIGKEFINAVEPFVWKKSIDYADIDEIRDLKRKIDSIADINDIKRGYGGIREIEFFVQTFQVLNGGEKEKLRTPRLTEAIKILTSAGFISDSDADVLVNTYLFLRKIEHLLQMRDDLQTHSLPSQVKDIEILSRMMGYHDYNWFLSELKVQRMKVRDMYNSILGDKEISCEELWIFDEEITDSALIDYLGFRGFSDTDKALRNIKELRENISFKRTIRERLLLKKVIPPFVSRIFRSNNKDKALTSLTSFVEKIGDYESYLDLLSKRKDTIEAIADAFCYSSYITSLILSLENLEGLFEYPDARLDYHTLKLRLKELLDMSQDPENSLRESKASEELKIGLLFTSKKISVLELSAKLTMLANIILRSLFDYLKLENFAAIGLGRLGSKELTFGSDLDLIFISPDERASKTAEDIIRFLSEHREKGIVYRVDMRLRPDGSKGILVNDIPGYRDYYLRHAQTWELQSLLKARPIAGDKLLLKSFYNLRKEVITKRGETVKAAEITDMRRKIIEHVSRDKSGYNIKQGSGGIEDIEFAIQYLQLKNSKKYPDLVTFSTEVAIKRLVYHGIIEPDTGRTIIEYLRFLKTVETILRLNEEKVLKESSELSDIITGYLDLPSRDILFVQLKNIRSEIDKIINYIYASPIHHG
ncbi:MAG: bifunctional [glutamate--ammonia ligase]-adenylyl-L-tyrosine phosphorylase/[glutamate--ammonia-ligase] adenylyltransferase [Thermodesulfovibrionales bacterium]